MNKRLYLGLGFGIWLVATVVFRFVGQHLVMPDNGLAIALLYVAALLLIGALAYTIYYWQQVGSAQRPSVAALLALPGMLLDAFVVLFADSILPNLVPDQNIVFGAWLLWAYGLALVTGFVPRYLWFERPERTPEPGAV